MKIIIFALLIGAMAGCSEAADNAGENEDEFGLDMLPMPVANGAGGASMVLIPVGEDSVKTVSDSTVSGEIVPQSK